MDRGLDAAFQDWDNGPGGCEQSGGLLHVEVASQAIGEPVAGEGESVLLGFDVFVGDVQAALKAAQVDVIAGDLAEQCEQHIAAAEFGSGDFGLAGLDRAACPAEHVDFPGGIESRLINVVLERNARRDIERTDNRLVLALVLARIGTADPNGGPEICRNDAVLRPGFAHARAGNFQVEVGLHGALD